MQYESNPYRLTRNFDSVFQILFENDKSLFVEFVKLYLKLDMSISGFIGSVIARLIEIVGRDQAFDIINEGDYTDKQKWIFEFYGCLSSDMVRKEDVEKLKQLYYDSTSYVPSNLKYLKYYMRYSKNIIIDICKILLDKSEENDYFLNGMHDIFYLRDEKFLFYFEEDIPLLKSIYLKFERFGFDHSCEIMNFILDRDCCFIQEYVAFLYEQKINEGIFLSKFDNHKDMKILWARDDYVSIFSKIVDTALIHKQKYGFSGSFLSSFFSKNYD